MLRSYFACLRTNSSALKLFFHFQSPVVIVSDERVDDAKQCPKMSQTQNTTDANNKHEQVMWRALFKTVTAPMFPALFVLAPQTAIDHSKYCTQTRALLVSMKHLFNTVVVSSCLLWNTKLFVNMRNLQISAFLSSIVVSNCLICIPNFKKSTGGTSDANVNTPAHARYAPWLLFTKPNESDYK